MSSFINPMINVAVSTVTNEAPQDEKEVLFHPELLQKFDINGPRYTSYPSADRFHNQFVEADYLGALDRVSKTNDPLSLYFHLPFCPNICYYCGCNKIITVWKKTMSFMVCTLLNPLKKV